MIFVDTGAWFASVVPSDANFHAAGSWMRANRGDLVTSEWVVNETVTLLRSRGEKQRAIEVGQRLFNDVGVSVHWTSRMEVANAWHVFQEFHDKQWSFTDCISRVVMENLGITTAFAFDEHFRQFGTVTVVP